MRAPPLLVSLALVATLAGCQPADPLDWKVSAKTPAHYDEWRDTDFKKLPPDLQAEFSRAFNFIAAATPGALTVGEDAWGKTGNPICRRLDGRTVRRVLLDGYEVEKRVLNARISTASDNMLRNVQLTEKIEDAATLERFKSTRLAQAALVEERNARLREIAARIPELSRP